MINKIGSLKEAFPLKCFPVLWEYEKRYLDEKTRARQEGREFLEAKGSGIKGKVVEQAKPTKIKEGEVISSQLTRSFHFQ